MLMRQLTPLRRALQNYPVGARAQRGDRLSTSSNATLGGLRLQARQRSDMENNNAVTDTEFNQYISQSYKELYDILLACYNNDYFVANPYQFNLTNTQLYPLPNGTPSFLDTTGSTAAKFYKLLGVDLQYSSSPTGWVTLKNFNFIERNKLAYPNVALNANGYTNLRYRLLGNNIQFVPGPMNGQLVQLWYSQAPTSLQFLLSTATTLASTALTLQDTTGLSTGMSASGPGIPTGATITVTGSTTCTLSVAANATNPYATVSYWNDSTQLDGISGWEEYVVIDAAIKAQIKQENDYSPLADQKNAIKARIEAMGEARDIGQAFHTSDVLGANSYGYDGTDGGWGQGGGGY